MDEHWMVDGSWHIRGFRPASTLDEGVFYQQARWKVDGNGAHTISERAGWTRSLLSANALEGRQQLGLDVVFAQRARCVDERFSITVRAGWLTARGTDEVCAQRARWMDEDFSVSERAGWLTANGPD